MLNLFVGFIMLMLSGIMFFIFGLIFYYFNMHYLMEWELYSFNSLMMNFVLYFDYMSLLFISVVLIITSLVMLYSVDYMFEDYYINRYYYLILLFVFSMMFMVLSPSILSILLGWDGLGLISYCLVIYYQNFMSFNSGILTILCNRLGDIGLIISISLLMFYGSWSMFLYNFYNEYLYMYIFYMLFLSSLTKSAQIPFSSWLPAAMAAPTPISALVHSSTLVTAGVYLIIRYYYLMNFLKMNNLLLILASLTMFMSGLVANFEYDLKKIIALSTLSQLGLMMSVLSFGFIKLAFFHLLIHAMFKSLLFLCAGSLIHMTLNNQDIRYFGGLINNMPYLMIAIFISVFSLCGFPFLSGFYSKDLIMEMMFMSKINFFSIFLLMISTMLTLSYNFRMIIYLIYSNKNFLSFNYFIEFNCMSVSMIMLMIYSIIMGSILSWLFFWDNVIILSFLMKLMMIILCLMGMFMGYFFYKVKFFFLKKLNMFFSSMWYMNIFYKNMYMNLLILSTYNYLNFEKFWMEVYGGKFIFYFFKDLISLYYNNIFNLMSLFKFMMFIILIIMII